MNEQNQILIYQTEDGQTQVDVRMENETVWLSANQMAMLFGRDEKTIRKHVNNVFSEGELEKENNTHFLRVVFIIKFFVFKDIVYMFSNSFFVFIK